MSKYQRIYRVVRLIPRGQVSTYGDIARFANLPRHARLVGYALHALPKSSNVPWQRVINSQGRISLGRLYPDGEQRQREALEAEGVTFEASGRVNLKQYRWQPDPFLLDAFFNPPPALENQSTDVP
ncbi:MAG: MGMT family protein [Thiothrix sp.]|nr:MGMT family protein [Thiothrix sp.]